MAILVDPAFLPAVLTAGPMTDEEFAAFCDEHPDLEFETTAEGELIVMPQTFTLTGSRNSEITYQLQAWARRDRRGLAFDSSTGFVTPDGARKSPDAAWIHKDRIAALDAGTLHRFWRVCPDFVIELKSTSDRPRGIRSKMREWITSGAQLAWLIDPDTQTVEIYRPGRDPEALVHPAIVKGEGLMEGFELDLASVWNPLL